MTASCSFACMTASMRAGAHHPASSNLEGQFARASPDAPDEEQNVVLLEVRSEQQLGCSAVFGKRYFFLDRELRESNDLALSPGERGGLRGAAEDEMDALQ